MGVYLLKKSFFARFLAHNTKNKQKMLGLAFMDKVFIIAGCYGLNCPHTLQIPRSKPYPQCNGIWIWGFGRCLGFDEVMRLGL